MRRSGCFTSGGGVAGLIQQHHGCSITGKGGVLVLTSIGFANTGIGLAWKEVGSGFVSSLSAAFQRVSINGDSFAVNAMSGFNSERVKFQKGGVRTRAF
jgi:hypothetical protein